MSNELKIINDENYQKWICEIKELVHVSQLKAAVQVNTEMIRMYWHIGKEISDKHADAIWGTGFYKTMSQSLKEEFPSVSGFSVTNLKYMKRFFEFYKSDNENRQQVVDDLEKICSIPWGHHILIMTKCENVTEALFYVRKTLENGWSRAMLLNFLDVNLYKSQGKAITNFDRQLPALQSDLAKEVIKDPYNFDFLTLTEGYREKELEDALTNNITKFLLELGQGFAYIGRQQPIMIGQKEMAMDLLFYHMKLRCYVVIDLKVGEFDASYTSQIGTYVVAVNHQLKTEMEGKSFARALIILQEARRTGVLSSKIDKYCSVLECIYAIKKEHKKNISNITAAYIGKDSEEQERIRENMRDAYGVRSDGSHGDNLKYLQENNRENLVKLSTDIDDYVRRVFRKVIAVENLNYNNTSEEKARVRKYFSDLAKTVYPE